MASTYSNLKIELIGTGDQSGTWGTTTNTNLGTAIEEAITGSVDVAFTSADVTLTLTNTNSSQAGRNLRLNLTGTSGGARNLTVPDIKKYYIVVNNLADAVAVKNSTGSSFTVPAGVTAQVFSTGVGVVNALSYFSGTAAITAGAINNTPIGATTPTTGAFTSLTVPTVTSNTVFSATGSITLPNGTTAQQPGTPTAGMVRFNSTTGKFEGYDGSLWGPLGGGNKTDIGFWQNIQTITGAQSINNGYNASSIGPVTVAAGASVSIPAGSRWLVL